MRIAAAFAVLALGLATGLFLMTRRGFDTRSAPSALESLLAGTLRGWSVPSKYKTLPNPAGCSEETLTAARAHWADHCSTCHANNGSGDSMFGRTMYPRPPDMRLAATQQQSDGELYYVIKNGIRLTGMPAFGEPGDSDADSWKLVCFVRHLPQMSAGEERAMRRLNPKTAEEFEEERQEEEFLSGH